MADLSEPRVQRIVLERVLLNVRKAFGKMELKALGRGLTGKVFEDLGREEQADRMAAEYLYRRAAEIATDMDVRAFPGRRD